MKCLGLAGPAEYTVRSQLECFAPLSPLFELVVFDECGAARVIPRPPSPALTNRAARWVPACVPGEDR